MHTFRKQIKDDFIADLGILPVEYDRKRGVTPPYIQDKYVYDDFDRIISTIANKILRIKKKRESKKLLGVFWYLYACFTEEETCTYVMKKNKKGQLEPLKIETMRRYRREIVQKLIQRLRNDEYLKEEIYKAIKKEYYGEGET